MTTLRSGSPDSTSSRTNEYTVPLSVIRLRLEWMPSFAGWVQQYA